MASRWKNSAGMRIVVIGVLSFVLFVPSIMIRGLIGEREMTRNSAVGEVSEKWGGPQVIAGPVLSVPLKRRIRDDKGKVITCIQYAHFLPEELSISGTVEPNIRHRGIYDVALYNTKLQVTGAFPLPELEGVDLDLDEVMWKDAFISLGITDMKGIKERISIIWNKDTLYADPGIMSSDVFTSGVSTKVELDKSTRSYPFSFNIDLNGSRELSFLPLGKETRVTLSSPWNAPSFQGGFLPEKREVSGSGFTADWRVLQVNRNFPQRWIGEQKNIYSSAFGVSLFMPVDSYQKTARSLKYALLFIGLTFSSYFVIEILKKKSMHPVHYLLIGLALVMFYTLLLSLSEHIGFNQSYLIASLCTVLMIT